MASGETRMHSNFFRLLWGTALILGLGGISCRACRHCSSLHSLGPPPSLILDMPPPPLKGLSLLGGCKNHSCCSSLHSLPVEPSEGWRHPTYIATDGDKAWPLAVVLVAGSATVLGSVVLLVLSRNKRWQPDHVSPGCPPSLPRGFLVGAAAVTPAAGSYDNSGFTERSCGSFLRQLQAPISGSYQQLAPGGA